MKKFFYFFVIIMICFFIGKVNAISKSVIDVENLTIEELQEYMDKGVITSEELVNIYLERINTYNDSFNAIITVNENIVDEAREADELRRNGEVKGKLLGIPIIVKDNIDVKGMPTTAGAKALKNNYPKEDSEVVKLLKDEGAIVIAKANMSEFAFSAASSYSSYGYIYNAYKTGYTSYGSSGGSTVAVALSFAPIALGTDTNSSVRLPASAANLVGMRPTYGSLSSDGVIAYDINRDTVGVLTKYVSDNALVMEILSGVEYKENEKIEDITIGVPVSFYEGDAGASLAANKKTAAPIKEMVKESIELLEAKGATIIYLEDFYGSDEAYYNSSSISGFTMCKAFNEYILGTEGDIRTFQQLANASGKVSSLKGYLNSCNYSKSSLNKVLNTQAKLRTYIESVYEEYDLDFIMYPSTKNLVYKKGNDNKLLNVSKTISSTIGFPSLVVPMGFYENLPYGLEFMAQKNEEESLYFIGEVYQSLNSTIDEVDTLAPSLYEVPEGIDELLDLYMLNYNNKNKEVKEWLSLVNEYFRAYASDKEVSDIKELIEAFPEVKNNVAKIDNAIVENGRLSTSFDRYLVIIVMVLIAIVIYKKTL